MNIIEKAFYGLYPEKEFDYDAKLKYSGKFNDFNANVKMSRFSRDIIFSLSRSWRTVSEDIKIGLLQELMIKIFNDKRSNTINIDLYNAFLKNVHIAAPRKESDPYLIESFERMNERFFYGMMDPPNLLWGTNSFRKLGSYQYGSDTITMSAIFKNAPLRLLDYVMFHEMLHKKFKFRNSNGRNYHHTKEFRNMEKKYPGSETIEKELNEFVKKSSVSLKVASSGRKQLKNKLFGFLKLDW
ncbi:MAG: SprT-like domain-containing protein [Candidatus Woesearchaeota archaeon]